MMCKKKLKKIKKKFKEIKIFVRSSCTSIFIINTCLAIKYFALTVPDENISYDPRTLRNLKSVNLCSFVISTNIKNFDIWVGSES